MYIFEEDTQLSRALAVTRARSALAIYTKNPDENDEWKYEPFGRAKNYLHNRQNALDAYVKALKENQNG